MLVLVVPASCQPSRSTAYSVRLACDSGPLVPCETPHAPTRIHAHPPPPLEAMPLLRICYVHFILLIRIAGNVQGMCVAGRFTLLRCQPPLFQDLAPEAHERGTKLACGTNLEQVPSVDWGRCGRWVCDACLWVQGVFGSVQAQQCAQSRAATLQRLSEP